MTNRNRRSFVTTVAAAGTLGLAGCLSQMREWRGADGEPATSQSSDGNDGDEAGDRLSLPGDPIDRFEDLGRWTPMIDAGQLEAGTADPYVGSQSAHLTAAEDTEYAAVYRTIPDGLDLSDKSLSLAVSFTGREQLHLTLELFAPNSRNVHAMQRTLVGPTDRWVRVDFGTDRVEGQPDLTDVREVRLIARRRADSTGPIDCRVDDLRAVDRPETGAVMLLFDGTLESHYTAAFEQLQAYGFAGVEAVIPEAVGETGRLTNAALSELDAAGWDMAARPRTGARSLDEFPPETQDELIRGTKAALESRGFADGAKHFVTPRNVLGSTARDLVREYHEQAFRFGGGPNGLPLTDPHNAGFFAGDAGDVTKSYVDFAAEYGQLAVLHFEHIGENGMSERAFADLLEYVDTQDVDVVTATDLLERTSGGDR
ncbi:polysaccharide deacetylase family protein [Natrinema sp. CGMCC1.2065]|uniref:polysaccharide deacetylase family protein n=1 Tax=Natrinema sp. CGMCC1.2065 TaxID=3445767 RepID=UPI003F4A2DC1